jgi:N-acetylmuramoyl-L-alanine amidase CwlA
MEIKQMLVPDSKKPKYVINGKAVIIPMVPEYITIHETDNPSVGANALAHARLQLNGNSRNASWPLQVDEDYCIQSLPFTECALHAGDNMGPGNMKSIAIEICVNQGGDFKKAVKNAAEVTKQLMAQFNISIMKVVQHNKWSGKNCPRYLRSGEKGINWGDFINLLKSDPVPQPSTDTYTVAPGDTLWGISKDHGMTVAQLKSINGLTTDVIHAGDRLKLKVGAAPQPVPAAQPAPAPIQQPQQPKKRYVVLPANEPTWTVYKLDRPCVKSNPANIGGTLKPSKFNGLEYEILKDRGNWVFEIQTSNFGRVQIFADPSRTSARVITK